MPALIALLPSGGNHFSLQVSNGRLFSAKLLKAPFILAF
jgi:hypothetical protein